MKKGLFLLLGIVLLVCAIDASLDFFYFTGPGKTKASQILSSKLNANVKIGQLKFRLLSGFSLKNVLIEDSSTNKSLLSINKIQAKLNYRSLFSKKIEFKKIKLQGPTFSIESLSKINLSTLPKSKPKEKFSVLIKQFKIEKGTLRWKEHLLNELSAKIKLTEHGEVQAFMSGLLDTPSKPPALFETNLSWSPKTKIVSLNGSSSFFPLELLQPFLKDRITDLKGLAGKADLRFQVDGRVFDSFNLQIQLATPSLQLALTPWQWEGPVQLQANTIYTFKDQSWQYKGEVETQTGKFFSSLLPTPINQIKGKFLFENDFLTTNGVEGYFQNKSVRVRGSAEKGEKLILHASVFTDLEPEKVLSVAKVIKPNIFERFELKGKSFTQAQIHTNEMTGKLDWELSVYLKETFLQLKDPKLSYSNLKGVISVNSELVRFKDIEGDFLYGQNNQLQARATLNGDWSLKDKNSLLKATLKEGVITSDWLKNSVTNVTSEILITPEKIEASQFSGKTYSDTFEGKTSIQFKDKTQPEISFYLSSPQYSLLFQGIKRDGLLEINKLSGYGFGTTFDITGLAPFSSLEEWNIESKGKVDTIALKKAWPALWEKARWLQIWKPIGTIELSGHWKGIPKEDKTWHAKILFSGKRIEVKNLFFDDITMEYHLENKIAKYHHIVGKIKEGVINTNLTFDFNYKPSRFDIDLEANQIDIKSIPLFFEQNTEEFTLNGPFDGKLLMKGESGKPESAIGIAQLSIRDGKLWDSPLLRPVWLTIRSFNQNLEKPVFKSASADFKIGNGIMQTDNLTLKSPGLILTSEGYIGFNQSVNMVFNIKFIEDEGNAMKVLAARGLNWFGKLLEIEFTGSLSEPIVKRKWLPIFNKKEEETPS